MSTVTAKVMGHPAVLPILKPGVLLNLDVYWGLLLLGISWFLSFLTAVSSYTVTNVEGVHFMNVAVGRPTRHIDSYSPNLESENAVDGSPGQAYGRNRVCSLTRTTRDTWWMVDLQTSTDVHAVSILNTVVTNYYSKLRNFYVYISETNPLPLPPPDGLFPGQLCAYQEEFIPRFGKHTLVCTGGRVRGRFVYVWKPGDTGQLTLCELEVLAPFPLRQFSYNISPGVRASQLSPQPNLSTVFVQEGGGSAIQCAIQCLNCRHYGVGHAMQFHHQTGQCWCSVREPFTDGDDLQAVRENVTHQEGYDLILETF